MKKKEPRDVNGCTCGCAFAVVRDQERKSVMSNLLLGVELTSCGLKGKITRSSIRETELSHTRDPNCRWWIMSHGN